MTFSAGDLNLAISLSMIRVTRTAKRNDDFESNVSGLGSPPETEILMLRIASSSFELLTSVSTAGSVNDIGIFACANALRTTRIE